MASQAVQIKFGDPALGCARVFINGQELHNIAAMKFSNMLPGQIPTVTFELHAPDLTLDGQLNTNFVNPTVTEEE